LATVIGRRLNVDRRCIVVGSFRWWLGIALLLVWQLTRRPILQTIKDHSLPSAGNAAVMRRADYFHALATKPAAAKELRVFGLGPWIVDRYRTHWAEGMAELWRIRRAPFVTTAVGRRRAGVGVCRRVWCHRPRPPTTATSRLAKVAVLLPVLFLTMTGGTVGVRRHQPRVAAVVAARARRARARSGQTGGSPSLARPTWPASPLLVFGFEGVSFRYPGASNVVFDGLDLSIPAGSSTAIVGANGAGKTTLVKLLARLHDPTGGVITVDGQPLQRARRGGMASARSRSSSRTSCISRSPRRRTSASAPASTSPTETEWSSVPSERGSAPTSSRSPTVGTPPCHGS